MNSYQSITETYDMIYHMDPKGIVIKNPELEGKVEQAYIYCQTCKQWKNLSYDNAKTLPLRYFSYKRQSYRGGYCLTGECIKEQQERKKQKIKDDRFWDAVEAQRKYCDELDQKSREFYERIMREEEERKNK